jgi:signal transduction histidine kinase
MGQKLKQGINNELPFEEDRTQLDHIFQSIKFPIIFFTADGDILKSNHKAVEVFQINAKTKIQDCFSEKNWKTFHSKLKGLIQNFNSYSTELELESKSKKFFSWHLTKIDLNPNAVPIFYLQANDISQLKKTESTVQQIYKSIPLGLIFVGGDNLILPGHSRFANKILDENDLVGKNIFDVLFDRNELKLEKNQTEALNDLREIIGSDEILFRANEHFFPKKLKIKTEKENEKELSIQYEAICHNEVVERYIIVLQENKKTKSEIKTGSKNDSLLGSLTRLSSSDPRFVDDMVDECDRLVKDISSSFDKKIYGNLKRYFHSCKGTYRMLGLDNLAKSMDEIENMILKEVFVDGKAPCPLIFQQWENLELEWSKLAKICAAMEIGSKGKLDQGPGQEARFEYLESLVKNIEPMGDDIKVHFLRFIVAMGKPAPLADLDMIKDFIIKMADKNSLTLGKKVKVHTDIEPFKVPRLTLSLLKDMFLHLINNSIDHGIETPKEREEKGKDPAGNIWVSIQTERHFLKVSVEDDGAGVDLERVKKVLQENKGFSVEEIDQMSGNKIVECILLDQVSTKQQATIVSGKGIGLDSVVKELNDMKGHFHIDKYENGCRFELYVPIWGNQECDYKVLTHEEVSLTLIDLADQFGMEFDENEVSMGLYFFPYYSFLLGSLSVLFKELASKVKNLRLVSTEGQDAKPGSVNLSFYEGRVFSRELLELALKINGVTISWDSNILCIGSRFNTNVFGDNNFPLVEIKDLAGKRNVDRLIKMGAFFNLKTIRTSEQILTDSDWPDIINEFNSNSIDTLKQAVIKKFAA